METKGIDVAKEFPEMAAIPGVQRRGMSASALRRDRLYREMVGRMQRIGWKKATIINLHAFELKHDMGYLGSTKVRARKVGEPYVKHVIHQYLVDMVDRAEETYTPEAILPVELAADFVKQFVEIAAEEGASMGGLFWYEGDREPSAKELAIADEQKMAWYTRQYDLAQQRWSESGNRREISERQRVIAQELKLRGVIDKLPEWVMQTKDANPHHACPECGDETNRKEAKFCKNCRYMFDAEYVRKNRPDIYFAQRPDEAQALKVASEILNVPPLRAKSTQPTT